jgi:hypothetical protein
MKRVIRSDKPITSVFPIKSQKWDFDAEPNCRLLETSAGKELPHSYPLHPWRAHPVYSVFVLTFTTFTKCEHVQRDYKHWGSQAWFVVVFSSLALSRQPRWTRTEGVDNILSLTPWPFCIKHGVSFFFISRALIPIEHKCEHAFVWMGVYAGVHVFRTETACRFKYSAKAWCSECAYVTVR